MPPDLWRRIRERSRSDDRAYEEHVASLVRVREGEVAPAKDRGLTAAPTKARLSA